MTGAAKAICHGLTTMLNAVVVAAAATTTRAACAVLDLCKSNGAAITARVAFHALATDDVVIRAYSSDNGTDYDTDGHEYTEMRIVCNPGETEQGTMRVGAEVGYIKVTAENEDAAQSATVTVVGQRKVGDDADI